jgi:hypothetical protein
VPYLPALSTHSKNDPVDRAANSRPFAAVSAETNVRRLAPEVVKPLVAFAVVPAE